MGLFRYLTVASGLVAVALGFTSCVVGSGIQTFGEDAKKASLSSEDLKGFQKILATSANPDWCKVVESSTFTESMVYTICFFYSGDERGLRKYKVLTCGYNSENKKYGWGANEYCEKPRDELVSDYEVGKSRRYFGSEELLPAEKDAAAQKDFATILGLFSIVGGFCLSAVGILIAVILPPSKIP